MLGFCWKKGLHGSTRVWFETDRILAHSWSSSSWGPRGAEATKTLKLCVPGKFYLSIGFPFYFEIGWRRTQRDGPPGGWKGFGVQVFYLNMEKFKAKVWEYLKAEKT